jgi:hypothetical protein
MFYTGSDHIQRGRGTFYVDRNPIQRGRGTMGHNPLLNIWAPL